MNKDEKTLRCIRDIANWLSCAFDPDDGCGFSYDLDKHGRKLNYSIVTLNNTIAPPLAQAAKLLKDPKLAEIANRAMSTVLVRRPAIDGKFYCKIHWNQLSDGKYVFSENKDQPAAGILLRRDFMPLIKNKATVNTPMVVNNIHIGDVCSTRERTSGAI